MVTSEKAETKAKFRRVEVVGSNNGELEAMILVSSILEVNKCLSNSIYGYFTGKMIAFPVVKNNVFNARRKYGIMKITMNAKKELFLQILIGKRYGRRFGERTLDDKNSANYS
nr:hypothetical protein [Tanacetum cinerariifolium]